MATTNYKVLGQVSASAATDTTLYTVPAATQAVLSSVSICNRSVTAKTYRIAIRPGGASLSNQHYVAYDSSIDGNTTITWVVGFTLGATDVVTVRSSSSDLSFGAFGSEIS